MDVATIGGVFGYVIAKQAQVKEISRAWQKFEGRKIPLVERSGIGPDPANAVLFHQANKLWPMPARVAKFNGKPEIPRQLRQELPQRVFPVRWRERRRELNEDDMELWREWFDGAEKRS